MKGWHLIGEDLAAIDTASEPWIEAELLELELSVAKHAAFDAWLAATEPKGAQP